MITLNDDVILSRSPGRVKVSVCAPNGKQASPYRIEGRVLSKRVTERHIFRARQAVGIDEAVWRTHRDHVETVRFEFPDGSVREIEAEQSERKSFLHGDGISFAVTRFVRIADLRLVRETPSSVKQLALQFGGGVA